MVLDIPLSIPADGSVWHYTGTVELLEGDNLFPAELVVKAVHFLETKKSRREPHVFYAGHNGFPTALTLEEFHENYTDFLGVNLLTDDTE